MYKKCFILIVLTVLVFIGMVRPVDAETGWNFELFGGTALNLPTPLRINQAEEDPIHISRARYETRPLQESPYYAWRVSKWTQGKSWELELVHHKIYLIQRQKDRYEAIDRFGISHGYNQITVNRGWKKDEIIYRLGAGIVLGHPHFTIGGERYPEDLGFFDLGFHIAGPTAQAAVGRRFDLTERFFLGLEGKVTASYAKFTFTEADGVEKELTARVPNIAVHGLIGLGYRF
ncbi:MAG: hypothetical protein ACQEQG_08705 [Bacillota bacterium]